jgi:Spy/CpxP family protein refolding chaperone
MNPGSLRKARLWLAVVFLVGAAIGAVFGYTFGHRSYPATLTTPAPMSEPERRAKRVADMTKEVGLNAEQSARMDDIIRGAHQEMKEIRDSAEKNVDVVREKARDQMRGLLTEEQKPKFESMVKRMDAERKKQQGSNEVKK